MIRVAVIDDHAVVLAGVKLILSRDPDMEVVATSDEPTQAVDFVRKHRPDAEIYVWNDLVDPHSLQDEGKNAQMYSSMKGVWDLLPPDLGIGYWTYGPREEGMKYFSERGRRQLVPFALAAAQRRLFLR